VYAPDKEGTKAEVEPIDVDESGIPLLSADNSK
jgi:hypothetical protein